MKQENIPLRYSQQFCEENSLANSTSLICFIKNVIVTGGFSERFLIYHSFFMIQLC